ncbi:MULTISPECIES: CCE_0567 family metalloprotein [Thiorhodovibrio]|uniref:CCE_0567 family metalloprotein n=1 Tax=Thiorhodovibrio TaxID=61593 RepID=UPI00191299B7|nr:MULTISPECIES: CCE_0567 family metalloprotein [Thiorhodovibrio]MBK5968076.1 hypothetical protein [Thiorhodovibrio winogradskyi]WPL11893.1 hypothetical protein Thiosp_01646 [Thiorhodovibrio litoralis]
MSDEAQDHKKALAKLKRKATEIAGQIHDIVEDSLWTDYEQMPELAAKLVSACKEVDEFKSKNPIA